MSFFCIVNCFIIGLMITTIGQKYNFFQTSSYQIIDILCIVSLLDPVLVYIFSGSDKLKRRWYIVEITSTILIMLLQQGVMLTHEKDGKSVENSNRAVYLLFSLACLGKIARPGHYICVFCPQIRAVYNVMDIMRPFMLNMLLTFYMLFVLYAQIGIHAFGGLVNSKSPEYYEKFAFGGEDAGNYEKQTWNDFPSAFVYLYGIFTQNSWHVMAYQTSASYQITLPQPDGDLVPGSYNEIKSVLIGRVFIISFILIANLIIVNIVMGGIIDVIMARLSEESDASQKADEEAFKNLTEGMDLEDLQNFLE